MNENRELILAAMLCDFQRFYGEPADQFAEENRVLLERYLDVDRLKGILAGDEEYAEDGRIAREARELSLMETVKTEARNPRRNLTAVFSRIRLRKDEPVRKTFYHLRPLSPQACFPEKDLEAEGELEELRAGFRKEMRELGDSAPETFDGFLTVFDSLLERYLWCITAADNEGEDISLYAHLKNTAVIAGCRWMSLQSGNASGEDYCLVMSDFSGIQNYIFSVNNLNESGVTKRLRARSFMVDTMVTVLAHVLVHKFQVSMQHILLLTGGKFYLLLPNTEDTDRLLSEARDEFNRYVFDRFKGQIAVNVVWMAGGRELLEEYSATVAALAEKLSEEKSGSFRGLLQDGQGWKEDVFELYRDLAGKKMCGSCGGELADKNMRYCRNCQIQEEIGQKLPKARYIAYSRGTYDFQIYGDYGITLLNETPKADDSPAKEAYLIEKLNDSYLSLQEKRLPMQFRYMANHIPMLGKGRPKTFGEIADSSRGDKKLGVLKADVDTLGFIFSSGLRDPGDPAKHYGTISRTATMSKLLVIFFSGYLNETIAGTPEYRDVYCVFSGGDDLFLIGPWNVMCDLALKVREEFGRFAGENPHLTISAAVELFQPATHIFHMAEYTEESLERVKNEKQTIYPEKEGRNGVACLGQVFTWEHFRTEWERAKSIAGWWLEGGQHRRDFPVARMHHIQVYSGMYQRFLENRDVMGLMYSPYLEYDVNRNYNQGKLSQELRDYLKCLKDNAANYKVKKYELYFAEFCMYAVKKLTREVRRDAV